LRVRQLKFRLQRIKSLGWEAPSYNLHSLLFRTFQHQFLESHPLGQGAVC
jgi:hypothetical protein